MTLETTAFILPYIPQLLCLLCTIKGFMLSIHSPEAITELEYVATPIKILIFMLKSKLVGDNTLQHDMKPVTNILNSIEARLATGEDSMDRSKKF